MKGIIRCLLPCLLLSPLLPADEVKPAPLTSAAQVHQLTPTESGKFLPVRMRGVITYIRGIGPQLVILDDSGGVMVDYVPWRKRLDDHLEQLKSAEERLEIGTEIEIVGHTVLNPPTPRVRTNHLRIIGRPGLPAGKTSTVSDLISAPLEGTFVEFSAILRSVRVETRAIPPRLAFEFGPVASRITVWVSRWDESTREFYKPGSIVRVRGILSRWKTSNWMPYTTFVVVNDPSFLSVIREPVPAERQPLISIGEMLDVRPDETPGYPWNSNSPRPDNVPVAITHAGGTANITINQQANGNLWNLLGTWDFNAGGSGYVLIGNAGTSGYVIADAVRFLAGEEIPKVSIASVHGIIAENSTSPTRFVIIRSGDTTSPLTVPIDIQGSATPGTDYAALPITIVIPAGASAIELSLLPIADTLPEGSETVSISLQSTVTHTVDPTPALITIIDPPYQRWRFEKFASNSAPGTSGPSDDPDADGNKNLIEFALGGDPNRNDTHETLTETLKPDGGPFMNFSFWRNRDLGTSTLVIRASPDMNAWTDASMTGEVLGYDPATDRIHVLYRFPFDEAKPKLFVRIQATGTD